MKIEILPDGSLLLSCDDAERARLSDRLHKHCGWWGIIRDLFEPYSTNGSYEVFDGGDANPFVGLTAAPCIAESMDVADDGTRSVEGRLWWYPDYMVCDPLEDLARSGQSIWKAA